MCKILMYVDMLDLIIYVTKIVYKHIKLTMIETDYLKNIWFMGKWFVIFVRISTKKLCGDYIIIKHIFQFQITIGHIDLERKFHEHTRETDRALQNVL